jgi:cell division protein FtsI/penicillin-binding protein 2
MTKILQESYNTGAVFAEHAVGNDAFREFLSDILLLDKKTGIDLPAEVSGDLSGLWPPNARPINFATAAFGQGIALTPIKLAEAFGAFANGGTLIQPQIVSSIRYPDGRLEARRPRIEKERIVSADTIADLTGMLTQVIEGGTGRRAKIKGYTIAGKTGTAQIPDPNGGYTDETIHTFAVYTPYTDPPFVVLMKLDRPIGVKYAEGSVVPATRELLNFVLQYYAIPPDRPEELQ